MPEKKWYKSINDARAEMIPEKKWNTSIYTHGLFFLWQVFPSGCLRQSSRLQCSSPRHVCTIQVHFNMAFDCDNISLSQNIYHCYEQLSQFFSIYAYNSISPFYRQPYQCYRIHLNVADTNIYVTGNMLQTTISILQHTAMGTSVIHPVSKLQHLAIVRR